jgi:hypothetical protein
VLPPILMRIFVDQRAISRNASAVDEEPVFVIEGEDGTQRRAHGVTLSGPARLRYDRTRQPRAWLEADDITEE